MPSKGSRVRALKRIFREIGLPHLHQRAEVDIAPMPADFLLVKAEHHPQSMVPPLPRLPALSPRHKPHGAI